MGRYSQKAFAFQLLHLSSLSMTIVRSLFNTPSRRLANSEARAVITLDREVSSNIVRQFFLLNDQFSDFKVEYIWVSFL